MAKKKRKLKNGAKFILFLIIVAIVLCGGFFIYKGFNKTDNSIIEDISSVVKNIEPDKKKEVNLTLVGDIMFEGHYLDSINAGDDPNTYLSMVADKYFKKDDITIGNLETTITDNNKLKVNGYGYEFCSPQSTINALDKNSVDVLSTTNNHTTDRGIDGINNTIDYLKNNTSIVSVGTYKSQEDRKNFRIVEKNGVKVGFVAYAMGLNDFGSYITKDEAYRVGLFRELPYKQLSDNYMNIMKEEISALRKECDVLVAIMHWGQEFQFNEREDQRTLATMLNELHVDVVLGSHSHCYQPVKWYTSNDNYKTLVFYSMGNFTSADPDVDRVGTEFDNAYQLALLANIDIEIDKDNKVIFNKVKTEPIINYYDSNFRNFKMIPLSEYDSYEKTHYRYNSGFDKTFINNLYNRIIDQEFR